MHMSKANRVYALLLIIFLAGCATFAVGGQFQSGRRALLVGDPETALGYFSAVAEQDPNYVYQSMHFRENIWTYLGRAQYETKRYPEARQALERALTMDRDDNLARLYLGLTHARSGDRSRGAKEIEAGMKGVYDWLEYMNQSRPFEAYWDPLRQIRNQIDKDLATISAKDFNSEELLANAEWLGKKMEEEIDNVRQDERRQFDRDRDFDRRRGLSLGLGIGF
jgi:tetratricopeptide (TPR) repeat protein